MPDSPVLTSAVKTTWPRSLISGVSRPVKVAPGTPGAGSPSRASRKTTSSMIEKIVSLFEKETFVPAIVATKTRSPLPLIREPGVWKAR